MNAKKIIIFSIIILIYSMCFSQDYWESIYCTENTIFCVTINSLGYLFAGTQDGVFRSIDYGESWEIVGLDNIVNYSMLINQNNDIFAGTGGYYNIYRSLDNGEHWTPQNPNTCNIISLTESSNGNIFAGSGGYESILRSYDNGETWELILSLSATEEVNSIVENSEGLLFIGTTDFLGGGGIYSSIDQGDNWEYLGLEHEYISSIAINSSDEIFVGSRGHHYEYGGGVFRSTDNGETWTELRDDVLVTSIAIDSEGKIYIGCSDLDGNLGAVHFSNDNGESWQLIESEIMPPNIGIEFITLSEDDYIYAISYESIRHIYRSVQPTVEIMNNELEITNFQLTNHPNPFNPETNIVFSLPEAGVVQLDIYNIKGQKIRSLLNNQISAGEHSIVWNGEDDSGKKVSSDVYLYKLKVNGKIEAVKKCLLLK